MKLSHIIAALQADLTSRGDTELHGIKSVTVHRELRVFNGMRIDTEQGYTLITDAAHLGDREGSVGVYRTSDFISGNGEALGGLNFGKEDEPDPHVTELRCDDLEVFICTH